MASAVAAAGDGGAVYPVTAEFRSTKDAPRLVSDAFASRVRRLFAAAPEGARADLILELSEVAVGQHEVGGGRSATVTATIAVRAQDAEDLAHVRVEGSANSGLAAEAPDDDALAHAAQAAADRLQAALADSDALVHWLLTHRIEPSVSADPAPRRGDLVMFFDARGGASHAAEGTGSAMSARAGIAGAWFIAQASAATWSLPWGPASGVSVTALGLEVGPVLRLGRGWELRGTAGIHLVSGSVDASASPQYVDPRRGKIDFDRKLPALGAALQYALWPGWKSGMRLRAGIEVRKYFDVDAIVDELRDVVPVAGTSIGLFLGVELPWIAARVPQVTPR